MTNNIKVEPKNQVEDLRIYAEMKNLLFQIYPKLVNYPAHERHGLALETRKYFFDYLKSINLANSVKSKRKYYAQNAEAHLLDIQFALELARNRKYITKNFYDEISVRVTRTKHMLVRYIITSK